MPSHAHKGRGFNESSSWRFKVFRTNRDDTPIRTRGSDLPEQAHSANAGPDIIILVNLGTVAFYHHVRYAKLRKL